jgi:hypothetical protein
MIRDKGKDEPFVGFVPPTQNYFRMPNVWIDVCAYIDNLAELKVVQYVLRHTWGFSEYGKPKWITLDEFVSGRKRRDGSRMDSGTGLSERAVRYGLERAMAHGFLIMTVDDHDKARVKRYFQLKMQPLEPDEAGWQDVPPQEWQEESGRVARSTTRSEKESNPKNTLEKHSASNGLSRGGNTPGGSTGPRKRGRAPQFIASFIRDFSAELGDAEHVASNMTHCTRLYREAALSQEEFQSQLYEARRRAKMARVQKVNGTGKPNRMPYFFTCLERLLASPT